MILAVAIHYFCCVISVILSIFMQFTFMENENTKLYNLCNEYPMFTVVVFFIINYSFLMIIKMCFDVKASTDYFGNLKGKD